MQTYCTSKSKVCDILKDAICTQKKKWKDWYGTTSLPCKHLYLCSEWCQHPLWRKELLWTARLTIRFSAPSSLRSRYPYKMNKNYSYTCQSLLQNHTNTQTKGGFGAGKEEETKKEHTSIWTELVNTWQQKTYSTVTWGWSEKCCYGKIYVKLTGRLSF